MRVQAFHQQQMGKDKSTPTSGVAIVFWHWPNYILFVYESEQITKKKQTKV